MTLIDPYIVTAVNTDMNLFKHLKTVWKLSPVTPDQVEAVMKNTNIDLNAEELRLEMCSLDFAVSFQFKDYLHASLSRLFFDEVVRQNVGSFLKEARRRFGEEKIEEQKPIIMAKH